MKHLLIYAFALQPFPRWRRCPPTASWAASHKSRSRSCWMMLDDLDCMQFTANIDSEIPKGFCFYFISVLDRVLPKEVLEPRLKNFGNLKIIEMPERVKTLIVEGEGRLPIELFPSLVIDMERNIY
ncbi:putative sufE-like protein 2, chloroplastic [Cocos nucifera]|uniref:Putative sufE-like protein 2, chloroplastic n=1 Tax=Cocos nucifera TaxID=13894 RepID=A0A8K0N4I7_COCNU|nr:putative sufE-like protein 2, chloroplastic [Cocos nucifera]